MKKNLVLIFLFLDVTVAVSQIYYIDVKATGGLRGNNCDGRGSVSVSMDTGPGTPIIGTDLSSGVNSFQVASFTVTTTNPFRTFRIITSGSAECSDGDDGGGGGGGGGDKPPIIRALTQVSGSPTSGSDSYTQNFTINSLNIPVTCGLVASMSGIDSNYSLNVTINVTSPLFAIPQVGNPGNCGTSVDLSINDTEASYNWQVSENGVTFTTFRFNAPKNITATVKELSPSGFTTSPFNNRFIRVIGTDCNMRRTSPVSNLIKFNAASPVLTTSKTDPSCYNSSDGRIQVDIQSANPTEVNDFLVLLFHSPHSPTDVPIMQVAITNGFSHTLTGLNTFGLSSKTYDLVVENNSGGLTGNCNSQATITLISPAEILASELSTLQVSCNINNNGIKNDGEIVLNISNGFSPFSYDLSHNNGSFSPESPDNSLSSTPKFGSLLTGNYRFVVTDKNGCQSSVSNPVTVGQPTELLVGQESVVNILCPGKNRGAIHTNINGSNGGYIYSWSATGDYAPYTIPPVEDPINLFAGNYSLTVTDAKGCSNIAPLNVTVTEPALPLLVNATVPSRTLFGGFDMTCTQNNGIIEIDALNEALPVASYTWLKDGVPFVPSSFAFAENLTPALYQVTVLDANNCDATTSVTLNAHPGIVASTTATSSFNGFNTSCPDSDDGAGKVTAVANAVGGLSYAWFDGSTNQDIFDLMPGNYAVTVIDGNGCSDDATLVITPPPAIQPNMQVTSNFNGAAITCPGAADGTMEAFPVNGFGNYIYQWSHGPLTKAVIGLSQGTYSVTVTDEFSCSVTNSLDINDPATMELNLTKTSYHGSDLTCRDASDGEIQLNVVNGAAPHAYAWSQGSTTQNIAGLPFGEYTVTVTDQNNCTQVNSITIINPDVLAIDMQHLNNFNGFDISCNGLADGGARAFLSGGTAPYRYAWAGGQVTESIINQPAGSYTVAVLDANDCPNSGAIVLTEPNLLGLAVSIDVTVSCHSFSDAQVSLTGNGGAGTYTYSLDGTVFQNSNVFANLDAGSKNFFLRDGNNCVTMIGETLSEPDPLNIAFQNIVDATCNDPVGSAQAVAIGGNGGFAFSWFNEITNQPMNAGDVLVNVIAGIYRVEVSDARNCQLSNLVAVSSIGGAEFDIRNIVPVTCFGFSDGSAAINVTSGIAPFSFLWSDGQSQVSAVDLPAGQYFATVTDGLGCNTIQPLTIPTPDPLATAFTKVLPNCVGDCDGSIAVSVTGGTAPYTTDWTSLGQQATLVAGLCAGSYDLKTTDTNSCVLDQVVELADPETLRINPKFTAPICMGRCDGAITVTGQGGTGPYTFQWLNGSASAVNASLCPGVYEVAMTDAHGCVTAEMLELKDGNPLPINLGGEATLCVGQTKLLDAGEGWVSVNWTSTSGFQSTNQSILISEPADYFLSAIDAIGCMALDTFKLATSLDLLQAQFLMPSETVVGDTLVAIDVSWPLPDRVAWTYPLSFTLLPTENPDFLFVVVPEEGTFSIAMEAFLAECRDTEEKQVVVLGAKPGDSGGRLGHQEKLITQFTVFPNPNDGEFDVVVQLAEDREIILQVVSFPKGIVEARYDGASSDFHQVGFSLKHLAQGIHFVMLKAGNEQVLVRFMVGN